MGVRAQSRLSGTSKFSQQNRFRWLEELYEELITEKKIYTDFRVNVVDFNYNLLFQLGGIFHNLEGQYISEEEAATLDFGEPIQWRLNKPQKRAISLLPAILDRDREYPLSQVQMHGARRSGKSQMGIMFALAFCIMQPYSVGAVFTLDYKSKEDFLDGLETYINTDWIVNYDRALQTLTFKNGSKIVFYSQVGHKKNTRGKSLDFCILDEASFYQNARNILSGVKASLIQFGGVVISVFSPASVAETMFYEIQKSKSPDPELRATNKSIFFGSTFDNQYLDARALRIAKLQAKGLSEGEYTREILGKYSKVDGLCLYSFNKNLHLIDTVPDYLIDITTEYICERWTFPNKESMEWICGCDYNSAKGTSTTFTLAKLYWGPMGGEYIVHNCIKGEDGNTETFIYKHLLPLLKSYYPTLTDRELAQKVLIVGDSSGFWQSARMNNKADPNTIPDVQYFKNAGFKVIPPQTGKKGMNKSKTNIDNVGPNPSRGKRREAMLQRTLDRYGQPHVFFMRNTTQHLQLMAENLQLVGGVPDVKSEYIHWWDALTYPIILLYSKLQLFSTDPDDLIKTHRIIHQIGQTKLTQAERMKHPVCQQTGKDFIT